MAEKNAFEDGLLYAYLLGVIDVSQTSMGHTLEILGLLPYSLTQKKVESLRSLLNLTLSEVDFAYNECKKLNSEYYKKNPRLLKQRLRTLDGQLEEFGKVYKKLNKKLQNQH
ncbi:MAG: hypothetical protein NTU63_00075 [Candidatus Pacearchaeota archaeon]|nr:hypothetical protein [Candidatus Pacearchaeota archaeon]